MQNLLCSLMVLIVSLPFLLVCFDMDYDMKFKDSIVKSGKYKIIIWDDEEYMYVVKDIKTNEYYEVKPHWFNNKLVKSGTTWEEFE